MPDSRDGQCGKMPHYCPGGGGMGTTGIDWCIIKIIVSAAIIFQMSIIVPFQLAYTLRIKMSKD